MKQSQRARELFIASFGRPPLAVRSAPGRVNLIGEHVDYHGGHVLPVATAWRTAVAVGPGERRLLAVSEHGERVEADWPPRLSGTWSDYVAGVAALHPKAATVFPDGLAVAVTSDLPLGVGLSSSAALEVATAYALSDATGIKRDGKAQAELAWRAETEFVGVQCGRMDQLASVLAPAGAALLINCHTLETSSAPVGVGLVIADSGEPRGLRAASAYSERRAEGWEALRLLHEEFRALVSLVDLPIARLASIVARLPEPLDRRVRHVVTENQRTILAAKALESGDFAAFGLLVNASHDSLRDLYECSTPRLDAIVTAAQTVPHALGARLVGAGWGGSVLVVTEPGAAGQVADRLAANRDLALSGVQVVKPGAGASVTQAD